jgi:hypothetical protein
MTFAAFVVSFTVVGELKDIELCDLAVHRAEKALSIWYRIAIQVMLNMRRWAFLTVLTADVVLLVIYRTCSVMSLSLRPIKTYMYPDLATTPFQVAAMLCLCASTLSPYFLCVRSVSWTNGDRWDAAA